MWHTLILLDNDMTLSLHTSLLDLSSQSLLMSMVATLTMTVRGDTNSYRDTRGNHGNLSLVGLLSLYV